MTIRAQFECRSCKSQRCEKLLDLGLMPLANAFVISAQKGGDEFRAALNLVMCDQCRLIQLEHQADREQLFRNYLWVTGTSDAASRHAEWLSKRLSARHLRKDSNFLVELASNDGLFLESYRSVGFEVLGVDPSNIAKEANRKGLSTIQDFFGEAVASRILSQRGKADVIVARNVIGHSSELRDLIAGVALLLARGGRFVIEHPYAYMLREQLQYDTIFHEHVSYPTVTSTTNLLSQFGLKIVDVTFVDMNGGSMLLEVSHQSDSAPEAGNEIKEFESLIHLNEPLGWADFRVGVQNQRNALVELLKNLRSNGKRVCGYGAAAKCMTMLNYCGIDNHLILAFADANPKKQGMLCPGVRIPVISPSQHLEINPDYILIGAWNLKDEIIYQLREYGDYSGKFIIPIPTPMVL